MFGKIQSKKTLDQYIADMVAADTTDLTGFCKSRETLIERKRRG
jgi:hypothetical protein